MKKIILYSTTPEEYNEVKNLQLENTNIPLKTYSLEGEWWIMLTFLAGLLLSAQLQFQQPDVPDINLARTPITSQWNAASPGRATPQTPYSTPSAVSAAEAKANDLITVKGGDSKVSQDVVQLAADMIDDSTLALVKSYLGTEPTEKVNIVLCSSSSSYGKALMGAGIPSREVMYYVSGTAGLAIDSQIWIPLYNISDEGELQDVLTHELTHVVFNQMGIGEKIPLWMNEGIAMKLGITSYQEKDRYGALIQTLSQQVELLRAIKNGELLPLSESENAASYNPQYVYYLAIQSLVNNAGEEKMISFIQNVKTEDFEKAFGQSFGSSSADFAKKFIEGLGSQMIKSGYNVLKLAS